MKNELPMNRRLITAALPYINNVPHLGHLVGSHLPADIFARYCRARGYETLFVGGTDENGSTSEIAAIKIGVPLEKFSDKLHEEHRKIYEWFDISYDNFSRTSKKIHHETTQEFFHQVYENGFIEKGKINVFYSIKDEQYLPDRYVIGTCPKCGYTEANGDQCEKCTSLLDPAQLINPRSTVSGSKLEIRETEHLFLRLDQLSDNLQKWINQQELWRDQVKKLALSWINDGLKPRCITRDLRHGVKVPLKGFEKKVFYVWFDAPIGYVSFTKEAKENWKDFWVESTGEVYHFLGKDNIPFHTIFWPGMIIANKNFNLPKNVIGLQYLNYEGQKFSKSKEVGVFCEKIPELNLDSDVWRHYLIQLIPESHDSEFRWVDFKERVNSELIDNYSNYSNRVVSFIYSKLDGKVTKPAEDQLEKIDKELLKEIKVKKEVIEKSFEKAEIRRAYAEIIELSNIGNKYINDCAPWKEIKENRQRANDILYFSATLLKNLAVLSSPCLPKTANKIWSQLGLPDSPNHSGNWKNAQEIDQDYYRVKSQPEILFRKLSDKDIETFREIAGKPTQMEKFFNEK